VVKEERIRRDDESEILLPLQLAGIFAAGVRQTVSLQFFSEPGFK
jgi:hypothetical protein